MTSIGTRYNYNGGYSGRRRPGQDRVVVAADAGRPHAARRQIGPLEVSPMGIGTWSWGNRFLWGYTEDMDPELAEVFSYACSKGINFFDTADSYGTGRLNGRSESLLGQFIKQTEKRDEGGVHIATKFAAYPWRVLSRNIVSACQGSLDRLDMDTISLGQLHWSAANYAPLQERGLQNGLAEIYKKGLVKAVGVSNYGPKKLAAIHRRLEQRGVPLSSAQSQFSLLSYGPEQRELKTVCDELGITLIAYSPLALDKFTEGGVLPGGPRGPLFRRLLPKIRELLTCIREIAQERGASPAQVSINWCIAKGTIPIPGVKSMTQAKDNIASIDWSLSPEEVSNLDAAATLNSGKMMQNIFQTV